MINTCKNEGKMIKVSKAAQVLNIPKKVIQYHIENGNIESTDEMIYESTCETILNQMAIYVGIRSFLKKHDNERFDSTYAKNRYKYIDFLEENDYFGIEIIDTKDILFNIPDKEDFYITKEDALILEYKSESFFKEFGLSEEEKVYELIRNAKRHSLSSMYVKKYSALIKGENNIYTPAFTQFVKILFTLPDIKQITDEDIIASIEDVDIAKTKQFLLEFFNFVSKYEIVKYHNIELKRRESESLPAYSYEIYVSLAKILFNVDYEKEHNLLYRALENSKYIETWMFLSCHYICGWRASDICDRWIYPGLKDNNNPFKINIDTLKEDIINENISDETYEKVALYSIKKMELSSYSPQKTGRGKLRSEIVPELRVFFGQLILVAEYHHIASGEGYMRSYRSSIYRNWVSCREFFGDEFFDIFGKQCISSRRLNKSYLQGMEQAAKDNGNTTLIAHVVASFARNHVNIDTTAVYLKDHGLTGESAEVVLFMMMQRGVFGVSLYSALITAYPEAFGKLSAKTQTAIMEKIPLSAYDLETVGTSHLAASRLSDVFADGETDEPKEILRAMYAIAQGNGKAKDAGVFCKKKALGYSCTNPTYESCIANLCPYHVFTSDGVPALLKVIKEYQTKGLITGNKKYLVALKTKIIPAFQDIINTIVKEMTEEEKAGIKQLIEEVLNG